MLSLEEKTKLLDAIMRHPRLDDGQRRLFWFILFHRMNTNGDHAYCSNRYLAQQLAVDERTIERAKQRLKSNGILDYTPGVNAGTATIYFLPKGEGGRQRRPKQAALPPPAQTPVPASTPPEQTKYKFYAKFGSPQLAAWSNYERHRHGQESWRDRRGGRWYPSEWPQDQSA